MKFAHLADCHIGSWRDDRLRAIPIEAFRRACDISLKEQVDFILISGDLFNTALPEIPSLNATIAKMRELVDAGIRFYIIPGSHDFSYSGRTMLEVLESAGLAVNVAKQESVSEDGKLKLKFTVDEKTGAKITGLLGRRKGLEGSYYELLDRESLEKEDGFKIFMFHSAIEEYKPKNLALMESIPLSLLPKNFDYYAGGHVHVVFNTQEENYGRIAFPGPLFPNDFSELEELKGGGFYIYNNGNLEFRNIQVHNVESMSFDCSDLTPQEIKAKVLEEVEKKEFINTIVTLRFSGRMRSGSIRDIDWNAITETLYEKGAYFVMRNSSHLQSPDFEEIKAEVGSSKQIEDNIIKEHLGQMKELGLTPEQEFSIVKELIEALDDEKQDGETKSSFENRILSKLQGWTERELKADLKSSSN
ncbi:DNA repair exonuclease [Candidatus Woesearchaeota archaeon]|nr:MAG: DNA repair exonuclease [Candidatus Woesearchaeota archaeon]